MPSIWFVLSAVKVLPCFKTQILASCSKFTRQSKLSNKKLTFESRNFSLHLPSRPLIPWVHQGLWDADNFMLNARVHLIYSVEVIRRGEKNHPNYRFAVTFAICTVLRCNKHAGTLCSLIRGWIYRRVVVAAAPPTKYIWRDLTSESINLSGWDL